MAALGPITLRGTHIRLEPMRPGHAAALLEAGRAPEIWEWMPARPVTPQAMDAWLARASQAEGQGREYPFVVNRMTDGRVIGSTRYLEVQEDDRTLEIGWTWYTPAAWAAATSSGAARSGLARGSGSKATISLTQISRCGSMMTTARKGSSLLMLGWICDHGMTLPMSRA